MRSLRSPASYAVASVIAKARTNVDPPLSQRDLAARLKRYHSVVAMIETNQRQVTVPEFIAIAEALGEDPVQLLREVMRELRAKRGR